MKYEIEIDDALVPEGFVPIRLESGKGNFIVQDYNENEKSGLKLICKEAHVPRIPDFVPEGWFIYRNNISNRVFVTDEKPVNGKASWYSSADNAICIEVTQLNYDRDALFGDLPPEQCCFQQKGK